jgi:hypothetical protein
MRISAVFVARRGVFDAVAVSDAEEDNKALTYRAGGLAVDRDEGTGNALDDGLQGVSLAGGCCF